MIKDLPGYPQGWFPSKAVRSQLSPHLFFLSVQEDLLYGHQIGSREHLVFLGIYGRESLEEVVQHYAFEPLGVFPFQTETLFEVLSPRRMNLCPITFEKGIGAKTDLL
jgi:hypothetical protein